MTLSKEKRKLLERLRNARTRSREGLFLVEGVRGVQDALHASLPLKLRFALVAPRLARMPGGEAILALLHDAHLPAVEISDEEMDQASETETHQGVILVSEEPAGSISSSEEGQELRILLLDGIQDPGNVGTLIRAARAFGMDGVVALDGTCDPWSPKAVRAAAGAFAHVPVVRMVWEEAEDWLREKELPLLVADAGGVDVAEAPILPAWALAIGNEGAGPREAVLARGARVLSIPMVSGADSLNAGMAGTVLLYALSTAKPQTEHGTGRV